MNCKINRIFQITCESFDKKINLKKIKLKKWPLKVAELKEKDTPIV